MPAVAAHSVSCPSLAESRPQLPSCIVVDDHPAVLETLGRLLEAAGLRVVALTARAQDALAEIEAERPDVAVCDIRLSREDGIELARQIRRVSPGTAVVVYTTYGDRALLQEALDAGVRGYVLKEAPLPELVRAIETVYRGGAYVDGSLAQALADRERRPEETLTDREREVLRLLASGLKTEEIGRRMFISRSTVKAHLIKAMRKLGASTRAHAVANALRSDLIS